MAPGETLLFEVTSHDSQLKLDDDESLPLDLRCSYNGRYTSEACRCVAPWRGARCNELPPPAPGRLRDAAHYRSLLRGAVVAQCDPSDPHKLDDCTDGLAAALKHNGSVVVPKLTDASGQTVPWRVRGFSFGADNARVVFEHGVEVQALKNDSYIYACKKIADLASINHRTNLSISGYGASWRMWREEYVAKCAHSEFRMGLMVSNASDFEVAGLRIHHTGGDGIIVMSSIWNCTAYSKSGVCTKGVYYKGGASKRVLIRDVVADHNCECNGLSRLATRPSDANRCFCHRPPRLERHQRTGYGCHKRPCTPLESRSPSLCL